VRTRQLTDADYRALARFRHGLRVFLRFSEDAARAVGLTPAQHQLLLAIRGSGMPNGPTVSDAADVLQQRVHSVVELVDRAEAAGLVERINDPDDRRRQRLRLTTMGEDRLAELSATHRDELRRFRDEMSEILRFLD
jgi:DNA-binding MarR family transcriptional regulator